MLLKFTWKIRKTQGGWEAARRPQHSPGPRSLQAAFRTCTFYVGLTAFPNWLRRPHKRAQPLFCFGKIWLEDQGSLQMGDGFVLSALAGQSNGEIIVLVCGARLEPECL